MTRRNQARSKLFSPEEGALVRSYVEDVLETGVDIAYKQGYLQGRRAGLVQALSGSEATVPFLTPFDRAAIVCSVLSPDESLKAVLIRNPKPEKPVPVPSPSDVGDG